MPGSVGLDIGTESIRVIVLNRFFKRMTLSRFGEEAIASHSSSGNGVIHAIQNLYQRLRIQNREVVVHIGGGSIRHTFLEAPLLSPNELKRWVREQILKQLPVSVKASQLIVTYHILNQHDQGFRLLVGTCQRHVIEKKIQMLEKAGLKPIAIGLGSLDLVLAFALQDRTFFREAVLIIEADQRRNSLILTENGSPVFYQNLELPQLSGSKDLNAVKQQVTEIISAYRLKGETEIQKIILVGAHATEEIWNNLSSLKILIELGVPLRGMGKQELSSEYAVASGLALKKYYPLLNMLNFLPETNQHAIRQENEKRFVCRLILGLGSVILLAMLILNITKVILFDRLETSEAQLLVLNEKILAVEQAKKDQKRMARALNEMQKLVVNRSRYAELMDEVARILPKKVWLGELVCDPFQSADTPKKQKSADVLINGWAFDEIHIADFLSGLEKSTFFRDTKLLSTKLLSANDVWKRTKLRKVPLIQFHIEAGLRND
jgi:Tfp pilus assembly protein PilN